MAESLPYALQIGTLKKLFEKIAEAATPERFTADYMADTLGMKGGNARALIPFLKKMGFLDGNGVPTDVYRRFRNPTASGGAMNDSMRRGYAPLFAMNENIHKVSDAELKGLVVQATGMDHDNRVVAGIVATFKLLKGLATFDSKPSANLPAIQEPKPPTPPPPDPGTGRGEPDRDLGLGMNLSYTINLNLPPSTDINVFNAIFRSLKENLLKR